jgi:hypothetical protein
MAIADLSTLFYAMAALLAALAKLLNSIRRPP